jgi:soluble lytic murein transglycosylase
MKKFIVINFLLLLGFCYYHDSCRADIYRYVDENGVIHFTNIPNHRDYQLIIKSGRDFKYKEKRYDNIIRTLCREYSIDTALVKAIIKAESDFDPYAVSKKGAQGLMQLMPHRAKELRVSNPFDPYQNLKGGIRHLRRLLDRFNGNISMVLAAYNAGENVVLRENRVPPFKETRNYIKKVMRYKEYFQAMK